MKVEKKKIYQFVSIATGQGEHMKVIGELLDNLEKGFKIINVISNGIGAVYYVLELEE